MDWQQVLVHDGQTIVITTGCALGITAVVFYRVKSRWGQFEEEKAAKRRDRAEQKRLLTEGWSQEDEAARDRLLIDEWAWGEEQSDRT
jgi:hypothetical protein